MGEALAARLRETTLAVYTRRRATPATGGSSSPTRRWSSASSPQSPQSPQSPGGAGEPLRNAQDGATGALLLIDELLTPDSSRFWEAATYAPGGAPPSYDKQYVRDYLETTGWNKEPPAPALPAAVVSQTRRRYVDAMQRLTGQGLV